MALHLQQVLKQTQRLIMTPQMQQSIQLLQLNSMELEQMISTEMMENPFLELADDEDDLSGPRDDDDRGDQKEAEAADDSGLSEEAKKESAPDVDEAPVEREEAPAEQEKERADETPESDDFDKFDKNDVDWDSEFSESDSSAYRSTREDMEEHDFTTYTAISQSLYDSLMRQLRLSVLEGDEYRIGEFIVGSIDEDGYLDCSLENQIMILGYPPELISTKGTNETDARLLRMLAKLKGKEEATRAKQLKHRQLIATVVGALLDLTPDEAMALARREWMLALIAKRLERDPQEVAATRDEDLILETLAWRLKITAQDVFDVLEVIHDMEPTGVGARNLGECLRLQCEEQGIRNRTLYEVLENHLSDLQQKRFREIAKALDVSESDVQEVFHIISRLDPKPGRVQTKDSARYITPDVYVKKVDGRYMYFLNEGDAGRLRVAANYRRMLAQRAAHDRQPDVGRNGNGNGKKPETGADATNNAQYANEKYKNAVWLIKNIEKRKSTVLRVTEAIMEYQKEFLEKGIEHLRPLTLRNIAEVVGMHESTIARVTTKKYVETPRGIFELKYFFSSGLETESGEDASSRSIKEMITQMIDQENPKKPLSDQKIADMLKEKGVQIARRTVAKYREQLKILPAKLRKEVG